MGILRSLVPKGWTVWIVGAILATAMTAVGHQKHLIFPVGPPLHVDKPTAKWLDADTIEQRSQATRTTAACEEIWISRWLVTRYGPVPVGARVIEGPPSAIGTFLESRYILHSVEQELLPPTVVHMKRPEELKREDILGINVDQTVPNDKACENGKGFSGQAEVMRVTVRPIDAPPIPVTSAAP